MIKNHPAWLLAVAALASGCGSARADAPEPAQGLIEFDERVIGFDLPGRLRSVEVSRGALVQQGAQLASLDDELERPQRAARAADLRAAEAQLALLKAGSRQEEIRATTAQLRAARETESVAARELARQKELSESGAIAPARFEDVQAQVARARAEREALEEKLHTQLKGARREEIDLAEARVAGAAAALAASDAKLAHYALHAPVSSRVLDVHVETGEVVGAGGAVVTLADTRHPYVDVFVPQGLVSGLRVGTAARIRVDAEPQPVAGQIEDIGRKTEFTPRFLFSARERPNIVVRVRVRIDDTEERLHSGVPAFVTFGGGAPAEAGR